MFGLKYRPAYSKETLNQKTACIRNPIPGGRLVFLDNSPNCDVMFIEDEDEAK